MTNPIIYEGTIFSELIIAYFVFSFYTNNSHIFSDSVGENALNVLHTLQQQSGILHQSISLINFFPQMESA